MILVGDVGGTRTRLALAAKAGAEWRSPESRSAGPRPTSWRPSRRSCAAGKVKPRRSAPPGPVSADGSIRLTNIGVRLEPAALAAAAGVARAVARQRFRAIATAIPHLPPEIARGLRRRRPSTGRAGRRARSGHGTRHRDRRAGSGRMACVTGRWRACGPRPGGRRGTRSLAAAAPRTRPRVGGTVLCGPGLERLYAAIAGDVVRRRRDRCRRLARRTRGGACARALHALARARRR